LSQLETHLVNDIRSKLIKKGANVIKLHGSSFSRIGEPDLIGCYRGKFFAIEVKIDHNKLSEIQKYRLNQWKRTGAYVGVARSIDDALMIVLQGRLINGHEFLPN